jgi:hypothetical protein
VANPYHHAVSSSRKWGGTPDDYLAVHQWFDRSKRSFADFRHRALYHHTEGIFDCEAHFGPTITLSTCGRCGKTRDEHDDELMCMGHEPGPYEPAGIEVYCDGSCVQEGCVFKEKHIPTRWVGEQHVQEDLGFIPHAAQYLERISAEPWMNRSRKLSRELEEVAPASQS